MAEPGNEPSSATIPRVHAVSSLDEVKTFANGGITRAKVAVTAVVTHHTGKSVGHALDTPASVETVSASSTAALLETWGTSDIKEPIHNGHSSSSSPIAQDTSHPDAAVTTQPAKTSNLEWMKSFAKSGVKLKIAKKTGVTIDRIGEKPVSASETQASVETSHHSTENDADTKTKAADDGLNYASLPKAFFQTLSIYDVNEPQIDVQASVLSTAEPENLHLPAESITTQPSSTGASSVEKMKTVAFGGITRAKAAVAAKTVDTGTADQALDTAHAGGVVSAAAAAASVSIASSFPTVQGTTSEVPKETALRRASIKRKSLVTSIILSSSSHGGVPPGQYFVYTDQPAHVMCQFCCSEVTTRVRYLVGVQAIIYCLVFVCVGLFQGCCLIPFFLKSCKDVAHDCPVCDKRVGYYSRNNSVARAQS